MLKKVIFIVIGLLALVGVYKYQDNITSWFDKKVDKPPVTSTASTSNNSTVSSSDVSLCQKPFEYIEAENGTRKGVVEVGASGFNAFAIVVDNSNNYKVIYKEFGESLAYEGFATTDDVKTKLRYYISKLANQGVDGRNIHFVFSSGALKNENTQIVAKTISQMGYVVNKVTAEQEGKYAFKANVPEQFKDNSVSVDIGSGNTKITYNNNGVLKTYETYGAKYLSKNVTDSQVQKEVQEVVATIPAQYRENVFIIGGVPYDFAKFTCEGQRYISLQSPQYYEGKKDDGKYKSGLNIYSTIYNTMKPNKVVFDYDANFTIGFLISLK